MTPEELEQKLAEVPPAPVPAGESSQTTTLRLVPGLPSERPPLEAMMAEALAISQRDIQPEEIRRPSRDRLQQAAMIRSRLPEIFTDCSPAELLARARDPRLVAAARSIRWYGPGFILLGHTGIGKSSAAAWMFRRLLGEALHQGGDLWYAGERLRWFKAGALMRARAEHPLGRGDAPEMVEAMTASVLFVDDAGWDRDDPSAVSHVLAERYDNGLPTVLTSGMTEQQLTDHYGDAPVRRLAAPGGKRSILVDCFED